MVFNWYLIGISYMNLPNMNFVSNSKILQDCFICDECNDKLESSYQFKQQCIEVYRKLNPTIQHETITQFEEQQAKTPNREESSGVFIISENLGENDALITEEDEEYVVSPDKSNTDEQEYEDLYLEFEEQEEGDDDQSNDRLLVEQSPDEDIKPNLQNLSSKVKPKSIMNRKSYTVEKKLEIIEYAEQHNNRVAARTFDINESSVRCFRRQKEMLLKMSPQKKTNRRAFPHWPQLESELREYVINHPNEHGTKAKLKEIKKEAIEIAAKHGIENFNGSNSYIFKFMQRHQLPSASPRPRKNRRSETEALIKSE